MDFKKMLQQQLGQQDDDSNVVNSNQPQRRENQMQTINSHNTTMFARLLPLGEDTWFAKPFETIFVDYTTKAGELKQIPVIIDSKNPDDKLAKLAHRIIHINYENRKENGVSTPDLITLNTRKGKFNFNIKRQAEVIAIPIVKYNNGLGMAQKADKTYYIKNYIIPWSAYQAILELMADSTQTLQNGRNFDSLPGLGFLTDKETFPIGIKYNKADNKYYTSLRGQLQLPPITYNYLQKDETGNYVEFDNPEIFDAPLIESNPDFYNTVLTQCEALYNKQKEAIQGAPSTETAPQAPVAPSKPVQQPTQPVKPVAEKQAPKADFDPFATAPDAGATSNPFDSTPATQPSQPAKPAQQPSNNAAQPGSSPDVPDTPDSNNSASDDDFKVSGFDISDLEHMNIEDMVK